VRTNHLRRELPSISTGPVSWRFIWLAWASTGGQDLVQMQPLWHAETATLLLHWFYFHDTTTTSAALLELHLSFGSAVPYQLSARGWWFSPWMCQHFAERRDHLLNCFVWLPTLS
jgi:hypothetical protein